MTERIPGRPAKKKVGTASKILVSGAAVGGGLALVGAMTAAAQVGAAAPAAPVIVRQVVVEPAPTPEPIVVIVQTPTAQTPTDQTPTEPAAQAPVQRAPEPTPAPVPAPSPAPAPAQPETESGGS